MTNHPATLPFDRRQLVARLAVERASLLIQLVGLDADSLANGVVFDDWSPSDLLGHVQAWDAVYVQRFALALAGRDAEIAGVDVETLAEHNEALRRERRTWSTEQLVSESADARSQVLDLLGRFSDEDMLRELQLTWGNPTALAWAERRYEHDAAHAADIERWRLTADLRPSAGPKAILLASLDASRAALMAAVELTPPDERATRLVLGDWTLKDVLGHVVDWEWWIADALRYISVGQAPQVESVRDHRGLESATRRSQEGRTVGRGVVRLPCGARCVDGRAGRHFTGRAGCASPRPGYRESPARTAGRTSRWSTIWSMRMGCWRVAKRTRKRRSTRTGTRRRKLCCLKVNT